ncbi:MAG: hypothetical protein ACRELC_12710, partial [Gemmatimonadota bacterium]
MSEGVSGPVSRTTDDSSAPRGSRRAWRRLADRRVPHLVVAYAAVSWGLIQFVDWLASRYALSTHLVDFSLVALALLSPGVALLAWRHGAPGRDRWSRVERVAISSNLLAAVAILVAGFGGKPLGGARVAQAEGDTADAIRDLERALDVRAGA